MTKRISVCIAVILIINLLPLNFALAQGESVAPSLTPEVTETIPTPEITPTATPTEDETEPVETPAPTVTQTISPLPTVAPTPTQSPDVTVTPEPAPTSTNNSQGDDYTPLLPDEVVLSASQILSLDALARRIEENEGVRVIYREDSQQIWPNIRYSFSGSYDLLYAGMTAIGYELSKYPDGYLLGVGFNEVCLYSSVISGRIPASGVSNGTAVMLDVATFVDSTLHHEIFHCIEYSEYNKFDTNWEEWLSYNAEGFTYSPEAYEEYRWGDLLPTGILTPYSMYASYEDRAEIFSYMMCDSLRPELLRRASYDRKLAMKGIILIENVNRFVSGPQKGFWEETCLTQLIVPQSHSYNIEATTLSKVDIYALPSILSDVVTEVENNTTVLIIESGRNWHRVAYGNITGYISDGKIAFENRESNRQIVEMTEEVKKNNNLNVLFGLPDIIELSAERITNDEMQEFLKRLKTAITTENFYGKIIIPVKNLKEYGIPTNYYNDGYMTILDIAIDDEEINSAIHR